ncbi:MAG: GNAT family N-acetyltransferase [Caldilineaceae bacterium]
MSTSPIIIRPFDLVNATEREYRAMNAFQNRMRAEVLPDDPPIPLSEEIQGWRNIPDEVKVWVWGVWQDDETIVASADMWISCVDNLHLAGFDVKVAPERRRQGLARQLLPLIIARAALEERRLLMAETYDLVPAGTSFMQRLGAQKGIEGHANQLRLAELDLGLLQQWQAQAMPLATDFELGLWCDAYPQAHLSAMAALTTTLYNSTPRDQLDAEDVLITPETLRDEERYWAARGTECWTLYLLERATGQFVGYTQVTWNANRPTLLEQGMTGVLPAYRNRGLGRWLKAAMLDKVLRDRPQVQFVRTGNADSNAAMLKINLALGFKPFIADTIWQVETAQVAAYLEQQK